MRPSPLILLALVCAGLGLAAVPLARLTRAESVVPMPVEATATTASTVPARVRLRFAHAPQSVKVSCGEQVLVETSAGSEPELVREEDVTLAVPPEGVELLLEVQWPEGTPQTAVGVEIEPDGLDTRADTRWTDTGELAEIIPLIWP